jgi:hypothetical protein
LDPLLLVVSDTHSGGITALAPPGFSTRDGRNIEASEPQLWLHDRWVGMRKAVKKRLVGHRRLIVAHTGDATDGNHHQTVQSMPDPVDQEDMAVELLRPLREMADKFYFVYGTDAHEGDAGGSAERICKRLGVDEHGWELRVWIGKYLHDFMHHGRASAREWSSMAAGVAAEVMLTCAQRGEPIPRFVWRGHKHQVDDSGERFATCRAILNPGWQLKNSYTYKVSPNRIAPVGYAIADGDRVEIVRFEPVRREAIRA